MQKLFKYLFCFFLYICGCSLTGCKPDAVEVIIAYTTDVNGNVLHYDFKNDAQSEYSFANLVTMIEEQQSMRLDNMVLLDCGNFFSGGIENFYSFQIDTLAEPISYKAINELPYDAIGVGNNDLINPELLSPRKQVQTSSKLICANLIDTRTGQPFFEPYVFIERKGFKIAVLGMVSPSVMLSLPQTNWRYAETQDMIECAQRWMPEIKKHKPDVVVGLFHTGEDYEEDDQDNSSYKNRNGGIPVAKVVPGFDIVLLGGDGKHSVQKLTNNLKEDFIAINAGKNCEYMGMARIHFRKQDDGRYSKQITASCINLNQYEANEEYTKNTASTTSVLNQWVNHPIGYLADTLTGSEGIYGPTNYRSLVHNAQLWSTNADISLCSVMIASDTLLPGPISMRDIFRIYPTDNQIQLLDMTGAEIIRYLEYGFSHQFETITSSKDDMLTYKRDKKGHIMYNPEGQPYLRSTPDNYTSATGIKYTVDISKPVGQRVVIQSMSTGEPFDIRSHYKVAINNHLAAAENKFITNGIGWNQETLDMRTISPPIQSLHNILREYIMHVDTVQLQLRGDWQIIPHNWWLEAKTRIKNEEKPIWGDL